MIPNGPYDAKTYEKEILEDWLKNKVFKPEYNPETGSFFTKEELQSYIRENPDKAWSLICPPPNAYARPHIGNISGYAYQDAMARYQRMLGKRVLVLPGKDHAGLEGEGVFVREVLEKQGRNKFDMKREDFYQEMMEYFMKNIDIARKDEREIGLSADFDRDTFTLDPEIVEIVLDTFIEMYQAGMIYKGVRIVNWDPKARTAVADNQIEYKEAITPFYYFKYSFTEPDQEALKLKSQFEGKETFWTVTQAKGEKPYIVGERRDGVQILGVAYDDVPEGTEVMGRVIGIQMRLNKPYRILVSGIDLEDSLESELEKITIDVISESAGSHIILFENYPDEKFYTNGFIIGTVRPETVFADTAIACGLGDERYKEFIGKEIEVEFLGERKKLNFIEDYAVEKDFGSGLLKITPAHSQADWEIANRHSNECLPAIQVIGYDLRLNSLTGKYSGMKIKEARDAMEEDMKLHGNLVYVDRNYQNKVQIAERTKAPIEPLLSSQWYLKYDGIKEAAIQMVADGEVKIHPENMVQKFNHWMNNLRDWAISRSLWWGYRLPVWYAGKVFEEIDENGQVKEYIEINGNREELDYKNPNHLKVQKENPNDVTLSSGEEWIQDENVLDTWFSSGQWVYATLTKYDLMDTFFPTDVMVSASDILENWDSRMMMFTHFKHKTIPFKNLFLTGLVLGKDGQKMSKSKGNILDIDQIKNEYGSDALRMTYFYQNSAGGSYVVSPDKLKNFKQFCNKIWNASRFVLSNYENENIDRTGVDIDNLKFDFSKKVVEHIKNVKKRVSDNMTNYEFGYATETLYDEFWHTYCDVLIEESKKYIYPEKDKETGAVISTPSEEEKSEVTQVMLYVLKEYLKMLHPFIPFITQKIWNEVPKTENENKYITYSGW